VEQIAARRTFIGALGTALVAVSRLARAQSTAKPARVGWLGRSAGKETPTFKAFADGLRDLGYVIGENLVIDVRTPDHDKVEQYPDVARRLIGASVDVILASNPYAVEAVTKATATIPVVAVDFESDPVAKGWVATLARPGRNITGFFLDLPEISAKQLQILKEVKPNLMKVAALGDARVQ
jgi:putative ABC transport system substrate-binding protein